MIRNYLIKGVIGEFKRGFGEKGSKKAQVCGPLMGDMLNLRGEQTEVEVVHTHGAQSRCPLRYKY